MLVLQLFCSILSTKARLHSEVIVRVDTYEQEDECYKVRSPIGRSLSMSFGSYQKDTSACALSKREA